MERIKGRESLYDKKTNKFIGESNSPERKEEEVQPVIPNPTKPPTPITKNSKSPSEVILDWLSERPGIKAKVILDATGIKKGNWSVIVNGTKKIPEKYIPIIEETLKNYGYESR